MGAWELLESPRGPDEKASNLGEEATFSNHQIVMLKLLLVTPIDFQKEGNW